MARHRLLPLIATALALAAVAAAILLTRDGELPPPGELAVIDADATDPFEYDEARRKEFERRASAGAAHILFAKSPGGAVRTAERVIRFRPQVEAAAAGAGLEPDLLEAIVYLESAGRPDAAADPKLEGAVGLTQILAETGRNLLAMRVDTRASRRLPKRIRRAERTGRQGAARLLRARRRRVDQRFDPKESLEATGRYLDFAREQLGRDDYAVAGYHMGVGNLQNVIGDFRRAGRAPRSYAEVYFGATPSERPAAFRRLSSLGDDSSTYLWRVMAAREIMRAFRADRAGLERTAELQTAKNSAEELLHPEEETETYADPDQLEEALEDEDLRAFPNAPRRLGLRRDRRMGELARRLKRSPRLYRALRPEAYALAAYMARLTREASGSKGALTVTSTVRDREYQKLLIGRNREATRGYSLHTTGYAFDVLRKYRSKAQARGFQFALDRLQSLNLIAWVREPGAIHVTVSKEAERLLPLLASAEAESN